MGQGVLVSQGAMVSYLRHFLIHDLIKKSQKLGRLKRDFDEICKLAVLFTDYTPFQGVLHRIPLLHVMSFLWPHTKYRFPKISGNSHLSNE